MTLILTAGIFLIMLTVMTLQGFLMYLYWRIFYQANIPIPQFWRPIPLLAVLSAVVGAGLALLSAARAWAWLDGRDMVIPDDVQAVLPAVARHRLRTAQQGGNAQAEDITRLLRSVAIP